MGTGLAAVREALAACGRPQDAVPAVLIGGTNGKGSTAAMLESIVRRAGYRTGLFHSPALGDTHEHVWVDGRTIDEAAFARRFLRADAAGPLSWFEAVTAAAFLTFAEEGVDLAIVEVGMGGARDCTNVIAEPRISAIATVDLDHAEHLGSTLEAVAREKSGIFRPGRPACLGWTAPEAEQTIRREAGRIGARLERCADRDFEVLESLRDAVTFRFAARPGRAETLTVPMAGAHQARNAALAVLLARKLADEGFPALDDDAVDQGLRRCRWPGRLEQIEGFARPVLLDVAHNPAAARVLADYLAALEAPVDLVFGAFRDKDAESMLRLLRPTTERVWLTATEHPRARPAAELAELWRSLDPGAPCRIGSPSEVLDAALGASSSPLCVTGSADLVGRVRQLLLG